MIPKDQGLSPSSVALDVLSGGPHIRGFIMRDAYRPLFRLALFGTYTLLAIGISEVRARLRKTHVLRVPNGTRRRRTRPR